jgi:hypothetical protein
MMSDIHLPIYPIAPTCFMFYLSNIIFSETVFQVMHRSLATDKYCGCPMKYESIKCLAVSY